MNTFESETTLCIYTRVVPSDIAWASSLDIAVEWCPFQAGESPWKTVEQFALSYDGAALNLHVPGFRAPFVLKPDDLKAHTLVNQACAGKVRAELRVLDLYAGYGLDGLGLATRHNVTLVEIQPLVHALQVEFAWRAGCRAQHIFGDAINCLSNEDMQWDVIYLDPMFPQRKKQALPNRGMQHLQVLSQQLPVDLMEVISFARTRAERRVVVKRRSKDPVIERPEFQLKGKAVRFDVYLPLN